MKIRFITAALLVSHYAIAATPVDGWYTAVFGGYAYVPDNIFTVQNGLFFNGTRYDPGYNAGGRVGFQSHPMRYEFEYTYLKAGAKHFDMDYVAQTGVSGYSAGNLFMANGYYDFPDMLPAISPFLGGGIGYAYLQADLDSTGPLDGTAFMIKENAFVYQATAGITYNFSENYAINIAYRYVASSTTDSLGRSFQANLASAGAIYHFDQGNYK